MVLHLPPLFLFFQLAICLAVYNETDGNDNVKNLLKKWFHKTNDTNDFSQIEYNWNKWKTNGNQQKYTIGTIMHYYIEQIGKPITNNIYEEQFVENIPEKQKTTNQRDRKSLYRIRLSKESIAFNEVNAVCR